MHTTKNAAPHPGRLLLRQSALCCLALCCLATGSASVSAATAPATTAPIVLYDGALGNRPDQQGFTYIATLGATHAASGGFTTLDTSTNKNTHAGYFSKSTPDLVLDRVIGYTVGFTMQVELENHNGSDENGDGTDDRAGFSLLVLSSDKRGIELGFWKDRIWAQQCISGCTLFIQAEGAPFDTQSTRMPYVLTVQDDSYTLSSNGATILSGNLRDYSAFNGFPDPYETPNLIFLGDDTSSASAKIGLAYVAVGPIASSVPSLDRKVYVPLVMRL